VVLLLGPPKSKAGRRIVGIPRVILPELRDHLAAFAKPGPGALVFPGAKGDPLRRGNFNRSASWPQAVAAMGAPGLHRHDLRHAGNTFAAASGAGLRDLMARMGTTANAPHSSTSTRLAAPTPPSRTRLTPTWTPSVLATTMTTTAWLGRWSPQANGTRGHEAPITIKAQAREAVLTWAFTLERVTGIEPALSAWETNRSEPLTALSWAVDAPLVTVIDPATPRLMARGPIALRWGRSGPIAAWRVKAAAYPPQIFLIVTPSAYPRQRAWEYGRP
jgi:hypothetical protein